LSRDTTAQSTCDELPAAAADDDDDDDVGTGRAEDGAVPPLTVPTRLVRELLAVAYGTGGFGYNSGGSERIQQVTGIGNQTLDDQMTKAMIYPEVRKKVRVFLRRRSHCAVAPYYPQSDRLN